MTTIFVLATSRNAHGMSLTKFESTQFNGLVPVTLTFTQGSHGRFPAHGIAGMSHCNKNMYPTGRAGWRRSTCTSGAAEKTGDTH
ncbi:hypothetical protein [Paracoccus marcusii]|uniref:hypothetical protein n=1 Tax=Paracoccus marcusii TaxID=59779 RepID=UPI002493947B|nr:hypothetical protein [Paracoccus marcusii]|tara:strand:- start:112 stop:366 length:255 start_codon:yes stop_codon:yes gene_type:complete